MLHYLKLLSTIFIIYLLVFLYIENQNLLAQNVSKPFSSNSTILPGYVNCLIQYDTSECKECPPNCITFESFNFIISNKELATNVGNIYEKSLRQLSIVKNFGEQNNSTQTAIIYLNSLLLKNSIQPSEIGILTNLVNQINQTSSIITLGKELHSLLDSVSNDENSSPIAVSILNIISKSADLLINSDNIVHKINGYTELPYNMDQQKEWLINLLINTIIGCEISGILGCMMSPIIASDII